ncbi:hypothetical protein JVU11DRAFT_11433 [Chiua virens]|nr:hypothetical protein JVU11DRAFT_11433 [Chiua virens]
MSSTSLRSPLLPSMADSDDASAPRLKPTQYVVQQIGGGRRRSPMPVLETPTRLRPRRRPTYADSDDVCKTLGIRSKPRAAGQDSVVDALPQQHSSREVAQTVTAPTRPPSRALPPVPCPSDLPVRSSTSRQSSLAPPDPPVHSLTSRQPSLAPTDLDEATPLAVHHNLVPSNGPPYPSLFSAFLPPLLPPAIPPIPVDPPSRPPSAAPQVPRIHPLSPAGPRKPSGPHTFPPSGRNSLPFTYQDTSSDPTNEGFPTSLTEDIITIRPSIPQTRVIPPTPQCAQRAGVDSEEVNPDHGAETAIPHTHVIPPTSTPQHIQQAGVGSEEVIPDHGAETDVPVPSVPTTPSGGRRSAETQTILNTAYTDLDTVLDHTSSRLGLTQQQVLDSWHKSRGRVVNGVNHWNVYQVFFKAHEEQERRRIDLSLEEPGTPSTMSRCYKRFIADHADTWKDILEVYELTEVTKSSQMTISQRTQTFDRFCRKISDLLDTAAKRHGFEAAVVICGNIVNEDASLGYSHTTTDASNFWEDCCRACPDSIIGHLKAHVYNSVSLKSVERAFADDGEPPGAAGVEVPMADEEHSAPDVVQPKPQQDVKAAPQADVTVVNDSDSVDPTPCIKSGIIQLVRACGVDTTKLRGANFPWKTLLTFLAEKGLVMEGYPHDILMPGEKQSATTRMKGLNSLTLPQKRILASALRANQVTLRRVADSRELAALVKNKSPVIVEEAPPPTSHHIHGRRMFSDGSIDHKGPRRVYDGTSVRIKQSSKNKTRYIEISDGSSPIIVKDVKLPRTSNPTMTVDPEPLEISSDTENISGPEASESEESCGGGDVSKKRKATSKMPSKPAPKKRMKHAEPRQAKELRDKKGKARESSDEQKPPQRVQKDRTGLKAVSQTVVELESSDEELLSGKILTAPSSSNSAVEPPRPCPRPRVIRREDKKNQDDNVFLVAGPSRTSERAFSDSLKKKIEGSGPGHSGAHSVPPSPSPPPSRVLKHDELQLPSIPAEPPAGAPSDHPCDSVTGPQTVGPGSNPKQHCLGFSTVDPTQPPIAGNGYLMPNSNYLQGQPYTQQFFGAQAGYLGGPGVYQGRSMNATGVFQGGNLNAGINMNVPGMYNANSTGVYQGGNMNSFGVYPMGQPYLNFPDPGGLRASTLPSLPAPPNDLGEVTVATAVAQEPELEGCGLPENLQSNGGSVSADRPIDLWLEASGDRSMHRLMPPPPPPNSGGVPPGELVQLFVPPAVRLRGIDVMYQSINDSEVTFQLNVTQPRRDGVQSLGITTAYEGDLLDPVPDDTKDGIMREDDIQASNNTSETVVQEGHAGSLVKSALRAG